jgi:4-amino-4-deoxy-L-arabinose transferase-like glycosyltransferase
MNLCVFSVNLCVTFSCSMCKDSTSKVLMITKLQSRLSSLKSSKTSLRLAQIGLVVIFLTLGVVVSLTASQGPDEVAHYYFNRFVAKYGRLPINTDERLEAGYKADLPPLFYLIAGTVGRSVDLDSPPHLKTNKDSPRLQLVTGHNNITGWRMIKTEDPYRGEVLLWYLGRWVTLFCGLTGLVVTYILIRATQPGLPWLTLSAVAVLAFLPTYGYISGITSYEPLTGLFMALYFLLLFYVVKYPTPSWLYFGLGLLLGLAASARQTIWALLPIAPVIVIWLAYRQYWMWRAIGRHLALLGLGLILTFGVWALYVAVYFNRITELGWFQGLLSPVLIGDGSGKTSLQIAGMMTGGELGLNNFSRQSDTFLQWIWHFFSGIWGQGWLGWLLMGVWGLALAGLIRQWRRETTTTRLWIFLLVTHIIFLLFFPFLRFVFSGQASTAMSQHILFPAAAAMMVLFISGLRAWLTPKHLTAFLFVLAAVYLGQSIRAIPHRYDVIWPIQTLPLSSDEQTLATFDTISLLEYDYVADSQTLDVTLLWRSEALSSEDYQVELTLVDSLGQSQARWIGQPLNGRYPTRAWLPEDRIRDEIHLPIAGLISDDYQLQLRVLNEGGIIFTAEDEALNLGQVTLAPTSPMATATVSLGEQEIGYVFWQQGHPSKAAPLYGENATVVFSTQERFGEEVKLKLVGPDEQPREPVDHTGYVYNFNIAPNFADGDYRLRVEQWLGGDLIAQAETPTLFQVKTEIRQFEIGPISQPVSANFAGYVSLLGYDLPQRRIQPGDSVPITLYWQALKTIGADLVMFNHLVDENQQIWGGRDRIAREVYSTMFWAPGEIVADPFDLQTDVNAPDGIYYVLVGLYLPVGQAPISLPLMQNGQLGEITSVSVGPIKVGHTPAEFTIDSANPQVPLAQSFGDMPNLTLLGYDLTHQSNLSEPVVTLTLYWQTESPLNIDYTTFVHLRDALGQTVAQQDQPPLNGAYPTSLWDPGEIIADEILLPLPDELPGGGYQIVIGLYDPDTGQRLTVPGNPANEVKLLDVELH